VARQRAGTPAEALDCWRRAVTADPRYPDARFNLAMALGAASAPAEGAEQMKVYLSLVEGEARARGERLLAELRRKAEAR